MPTIGLDGEIPKKAAGAIDAGFHKSEANCPDCEGGKRNSHGLYGFGIVTEDCETCRGTGKI